MNDRNTYRAQFAAYFSGKLSAEESDALEQALARDAKLAREAEAVRPVVDAMAQASAEDSTAFRLSADRLALIRAAASRQIVEFPRMAAASRRDVSLWRKLGPGLAAAVAVVIGAVSGFNTGREDFEGDRASWQLAAQMQPEDVVDNDPVYYYSPVYALDRHVSWPARSAARAEFTMNAPVTYGLPGPAPLLMYPGDLVRLR